MAKRESKGQQVKTFKHFVPLADLKAEETIGKVYFQAERGEFAIYLPEHIAAVADGLPGYEKVYDTAGAKRHRGVITSATIDKALAAYNKTLRDYKTMQENAQREKVIQVEFKANLRWIREFHQGKRSTDFHDYTGRMNSISFVGSPTIHLSYRVLFKVNDGLYSIDRGEEPGERMTYIGKAQGKCIPWTQEREDFFARVVDNIERLIMAMTEFMEDVEGNVDFAIAHNGGQLAIAPPKD